jgi:hypothetical protein
MKVILPPIITVLLIVGMVIFIGVFPPAQDWLDSEANFNLLSPLFLIRNGVLILLGIIFTYIFGDGFGKTREGRGFGFRFLLPVVMGLAGAGLFVLLVEPLLFPRGSFWTISLFVLIWVVAEEIYFRSFLTRSLMNASNPDGANLIALLFSSVLYAVWNITYSPIVGKYDLMGYFSISVLFFFILALPVTASYYYTRSLISSGITNLIIKGIFVGYCVYILS